MKFAEAVEAILQRTRENNERAASSRPSTTGARSAGTRAQNETVEDLPGALARIYRGGGKDLRTLAGFAINPPSAALAVGDLWALQQEEIRKWINAARAAGVKRKNPALDNQFDAQRHAEFSALLARRYGPHIASAIMEAWELNPFSGDTAAAHAMDRYNNSVGIGSYVEGRPYGVENLQTDPNRPPARPWRSR
jgi:hypothetical protein